MTDRTQSAVEAMALSIWRAKGGIDRVFNEGLAGTTTRGSNLDLEVNACLREARAALTALHFHLLASSWQIVPRAATMAMASACPRVVDYSSAVKAWTAMLAAAPQFLGREG